MLWANFYTFEREEKIYIMRIKDITNYIESLAPLATQESYDNSGLIVGSPQQEIDKILVTLDCLEETVEEAINQGAGLIVAHHPILFKKIKSLTGKDYVERVLLKAIKNDIGIYACHTNLDNYNQGVNKEIANRLGIEAPEILQPMQGQLLKLAVFVPRTHEEEVSKALFEAGAGSIGEYDNCSFKTLGTGSFRASENSDPFVGKKGEIHYEEEVKLEVILKKHQEGKVLSGMLNAHPYEEVAYDLYALENKLLNRGAGMIGELKKAKDTTAYLNEIKQAFKVSVIRHTNLCKKEVKKIAWCGGSGFFLLGQAMRKQADLYITGDVKYHEFFDADNQIILADIGHYESEQFTIQRISELLTKKFPNFAVCLTKLNTNPINYL